MRNGIKILTFDVGGSVFDWQTATRRAVRKIADARGVDVDDGEFTMTWRRRMFQQLARVRSGDLPWQNADQLHRSLLDELAAAYPQLELTAADRDDLNRAWHRMGVWDDVPEALKKLREHYIVSILTVLSLSIVVDSSRHAGIDWDAYISCEFLGVYKPEAAAYQAAARLLGAEPQEVMMVAVHPGDLLAGQRAGLKTGYVEAEGVGARGRRTHGGVRRHGERLRRFRAANDALTPSRRRPVPCEVLGTGRRSRADRAPMGAMGRPYEALRQGSRVTR